MDKIKIAIVDDHKLLSQALEDMISANENFEVIANCTNGEKFMDYLDQGNIKPDVTLMDVNMPVMNGVETTRAITKKYPEIKVLALTMEDGEETIIKMLKAGARGYLLKDMTSELLFSSIKSVYEHGFLTGDGNIALTTAKFRSEKSATEEIINNLKDKERQLIKLSCTELTYKQIAEVMMISHKTVDNYRDHLFVKLDVKSRVGVVMFAIRNNLD